MSKKTIDIFLKAHDQASKELKNVNESVKNYSKYGDKAVKTGGALAIASGGVATVLGSNVKVAMEFEQKQKDLKSTMEASESQMKDLTKVARENGKTTALSASESMDALKLLAQSGYKDTNKMAEILNGTVGLSTATNYDLSKTTELVSSQMKTFKKNGYKASDVANILAKTTTMSNASMSKLNTSLPQVASTVDATGGSLEQTASQLGVLYDNGLKAETASSGLTQVYSKLLDPTKQQEQAMKDLNLTMKDLDPTTNDMADIMDKLKNKNADAKDLTKLFGSENMKVAKILMDNTDTMRSYESQLGNTGGTVEKMSKTQMSSMQGQLKLLKSQFEEAQIAIGQVFLPILKKLIEILQSVMNWFNGLSDTQKKWIAIVTGVITVSGLLVGGLLVVIGVIMKMIPAILQGWKVVKLIGQGFMWLSRLLMANPIILVITAIIAVIYVLYKAWKGNWFGIRDISKNVLNWIGDKFNAFKEWLFEIVIKIVSWFLKKWEELTDLVSIIGDIFSNVVGAVGDGLQSAYDTLTGWISSFFDGGAALIGAVADGISSAVGKVGDAVGWIANKARGFFGNSDAKYGPLSDITQSGHDTMKAFSRGAMSAQSMVSKSMQTALSGTVSVSNGGKRGASFKGTGSTVNNVGNNMTIHIQNAEGLDEEEIARRIKEQMYKDLR